MGNEIIRVFMEIWFTCVNQHDIKLTVEFGKKIPRCRKCAKPLTAKQ